MRVIFVNRFYWPDTTATAQLLTDLAEALAPSHEITVISGGSPGAPIREQRNGVNIIRVPNARTRSHGVGGKAAAFGRFGLSAVRHLSRVTRRGDIIVTLTDPPLFGIASASVAKAKGARLVHWIQDIYPEVVSAVSGRRYLDVLVPVRNGAWRAASACVALGHDMASLVSEAGVPQERLKIIANWAPAGLTPKSGDGADITALRRQWGLTDRFVVQYSGNLGRVHDLDTVLDAAALLRAESRIHFLFVGDGAQRVAIEARASQLGLPNVQFQPPQPRAVLASSLAVGDVHLVTLRRGCERLVFPSKVYGIAAVGRPIVFVGPPGELAQTVRERGMGAAATDASTLAETLQELSADPNRRDAMSRAAMAYADENSLPRAVLQWRALLDQISAC